MNRFYRIMLPFNLFVILAFITTIGCEQKPKTIPTTPPSTVTPPDRVTSDDVKRDANQAAQTTTEYAKQEKEKFQEQLNIKMQELDTKIVELRKKGENLKDDAKIAWDKKMSDLQAKREAMKVKFDEFKASTALAWEDLKKGVQSAWDDLDGSIRDASNEYKDNPSTAPKVEPSPTTSTESPKL